MRRHLIFSLLLFFTCLDAGAQTAVRRDSYQPVIAQAIQSLRPGAQFNLPGNTLAGLEWLDSVHTRPSDAAITAEIARINTLPLGALSTASFIGRWTTTEYSNLMKARATAISGNTAGMALVKQWDQAVVIGVVDMTTQAAKDFKAALVSAAILTQARADVIFQ